MDAHCGRGDTAAMDADTRHELMDEAERLALQAFGDYADASHIEAVFERLAWCWQHGLPADGAVTVH
ncbi:hypothetical protein [uncultured Castellaniella sp.]|uniref:hypothetical protein n=1 Tax=uncultured Castellaniella sp. TaxID=647907 RepID=UPI00262EE12E|nr:hypothetical protein [uncultured Castellaniella sp.]